MKNRGYNNLWSPWRCTVVYIGTVAIGLTIIEMSEEVEVRYVNGKYIREQDYVSAQTGTVCVRSQLDDEESFSNRQAMLASLLALSEGQVDQSLARNQE